MKNIGYAYQGYTAARLKRFLRVGGQEFMFNEMELNEFEEPTEVVKNAITVLGVLHKSSGQSRINSSEDKSDGSQTRSNLSISITTSWEALISGYSGGKELVPGMYITILNTRYKIIKTENINNWGIVAEISLEEYDGWEH